MKLILAAIVAFASAAPVLKLRVFVRPDGSVIVLIPNPRMCETGESADACLSRIAAKDCPRLEGVCLPSFDVSPGDLPPVSKRNAWRGNVQTRTLSVDEAAVPRIWTAYKALFSGKRVGVLTLQDLTAADAAELRAQGYTVEEVR